MQNSPDPVKDGPQDVSEHYSIFNSFFFYYEYLLVPLLAVSPSSYLNDLIARHSSYISHIFLSCVLTEASSRGTAVIEVKPLVVTVPALILMEAHIIAQAIKEVQMLSGSAHIVISQCNTSLIFVVF